MVRSRRLPVLYRKLVRDLWHLRGPVAAVVLVAVSGVAVFVTLRSMYGYLLETQADYYRRHRFAQVFASVKEAPLDVARRLEALPGVAAVEARIVADVVLDVPGLAEPAIGRLITIPDRRRPTLNELHLRRGRWVAPDRTDEVIASDAFAAANGLEPGDSFGAVIHGRWQRLTVVGTAISPEYVYEIGPGQLFPDNRRFGVLWVGRETLEAAFDMEGSFNDVVLALAPGAGSPAAEAAVIDRVDRVLDPWGGLGAYGRDDQLSHRFVRDEIAETRVTSLLVPAIFLGVTAFLLHLVMQRLVGTQRDQIAILKAFGYGDRAIGRHYLEMALVPALAGAAIGTLLGLRLADAMAVVYARFFQFPQAEFHPRWGVVAAAVTVAAGSALAGALAAVRQAVTLAPAEAMRPPTPARFRPGWIERLGLGRRLPLSGRIILRHLDRQPVKAALSVLGIALAFAIVLVGWGLFDAIDRLKEVQFEQVQREDVVVSFRDVHSSSVRHELARLPGVLRTEPTRQVAARLVAGHRSERTAILGLPADGRLRQIVGRGGRRYRPPPEGLLLTEKLAELLAVEPGDRVTLEILEGERPVLRVPVTATAAELLGTAAYMDLGALHRLMDEGPVLSGALLAADEARLDELYARLKRMPGVAGVAVKGAVVAGFEATLEESLRISFVTIVLFASVLAFGMVYNGARIALSERGRELASLRVLGFSRREVATMLLGEQALLTAFALPVGVALGVGLLALFSYRFDTELFRLPFVVAGPTLALSVLVTGAAAFVSALAVRRRIGRLDLIEVLKTRE